jgi:micrococcal nuclease
LSAEYWASKKSDKYHYPTCEWAKKINPENLVKFTTPEDAVKAGFVPCKVCQPPPGKKP